MAKQKGKGPGEDEFEDAEWDEDAADEALFGEDDEEEGIDELQLSGDLSEEESTTAEGETEEVEEEVEESTVGDTEEEAPAAAAPAPKAMQQQQKLEPVSLKELPVAMVIEVGRLQLSAQQLMDMRKGNVLDLRVQPAAGVDLVVNNQLVGRGELVQVGETLAVRVLEIGK